MTTHVAYILIATLVTLTMILIGVEVVIAVRQSSKVDRKAEGESITVKTQALQKAVSMNVSIRTDAIVHYLIAGIAADLDRDPNDITLSRLSTKKGSHSASFAISYVPNDDETRRTT